MIMIMIIMLTLMRRSSSQAWKKMGTGASRITDPLPESSPRPSKRGLVMPVGSVPTIIRDRKVFAPRPTESLRDSS